MATLGVRRLKERGGGGGGRVSAVPLKQSKPLTPISEKTKALLSNSAKRSAGPEKPRSMSRGPAASQKPVIRPMPRIDRLSAVAAAAADDAEARRRLSSTSSVPRGRSSSSADFTRILSDLRRTRVASRVPADSANERVSVSENGRSFTDMSGVKAGKGFSELRASEKKGPREPSFRGNEQRFCEDFKENVNVGGRSGRTSTKAATEIRVKKEMRRDVKLNSKENEEETREGLNNRRTDGSLGDVKSFARNVGKPGSGEFEEDSKKSLDAGHNCNLGSEVRKTGQESSLRVRVGKFGPTLKVADASKEKDANCSGSSGKFNSKLHEKLAFLEGKVKRIASDIKRTKEMLDTNNPDASKIILSDIQQKISGIEKAMSGVIGVSDGNLGLSRSTDNVPEIAKEMDQTLSKLTNQGKISVKCLNSADIEARLFPHHKLLKSRNTVNMSSVGSKTEELCVSEINKEQSLENVRSMKEILNAQELFASLDMEKPKANVITLTADSKAHQPQETEDGMRSDAQQTSVTLLTKSNVDLELVADECLDEFDDQENKPIMIVGEDLEEENISQLREVGHKTAAGGWFVSEGESILLAHDDNSCSFYDIANNEEKAEYRPPTGLSTSIWRDCWLVRAASADGCSGKYIVAASAGNTLESGFCSWDFYTKRVEGFHLEEKRPTGTRSILGPLEDNVPYRGNALPPVMSTENRQWWYRPCAPLIASTATNQRAVQIYDIRDGEMIMKWDVAKPVTMMDYSSPLQWRNRGKLLVAEADSISLWDVCSLNPQALLSVSSSGRTISALHVCNTDAEPGGGVRQRVTSGEAEGHDGVFCTPDSINILDFRNPSGVGMKIPKVGSFAHSVFSRGDSVFLGCSGVRSSGKKQSLSQVQQFSLRKQKMVSTYVLPESNAHSHQLALNQVWGNSSLVMGISGQGLYVFDALKDDGLPSFVVDYGSPQKAREVIGPDDLYCPSFDYYSSQVLLISRDRPAMFRHL